MATRVSERDLILPTLRLLAAAPNGEMQTADIIDQLEAAYGPIGEDAELLDGRNDTKFSQKVRNLKSHDTLVKLGYAVRIPGGFRITPAGRAYVAANP